MAMERSRFIRYSLFTKSGKFLLKAKGYFNTPSYLAWAFQSGSPLKPDFDRAILKLSEVTNTNTIRVKLITNMKAGLVEYWLEELLVAASKEGKESDKRNIQQV